MTLKINARFNLSRRFFSVRTIVVHRVHDTMPYNVFYRIAIGDGMEFRDGCIVGQARFTVATRMGYARLDTPSRLAVKLLSVKSAVL